MAGNPEFLGHVRDRPARENPFNEQFTAMNSQTCINVGHENLRNVKS